MFSAVDVYIIATQAIKHELYNAGVIFYEILVQQLKKEEQVEINIPAYFGESKLTFQLSKKLLKTAQQLLNRILEKRGPYGNLHRCNSKPFSFHKHETLSYEVMKNKTTGIAHEEFQSYRKERKVPSSPRRTENGENYDIENYQATAIECDLLCKGIQITVIYYLLPLVKFYLILLPFLIFF